MRRKNYLNIIKKTGISYLIILGICSDAKGQSINTSSLIYKDNNYVEFINTSNNTRAFSSKWNFLRISDKEPSSTKYFAGAKVYPSNVKDTVFIEPTSIFKTISKIEIINKNGEVLKTQKIKNSDSESVKSLNLSGMESGIYFVRISYKKELVSDLIRIVKE